MSVEGTRKTKFETFLFRPDLVDKGLSKPAKVGMCVLSSAFGIATLGLAHLGFAAKHVFRTNLKEGDKQGLFKDLLTKLGQLRDKKLYTPREIFTKQFSQKQVQKIAEELKQLQEEADRGLQSIENIIRQLSEASQEPLRKLALFLKNIIDQNRAPTPEEKEEYREMQGQLTKEQKNNAFNIEISGIWGQLCSKSPR